MARSTAFLLLIALGSALFLLLTRLSNQDALHSVLRSKQLRSIVTPNQLTSVAQQPLGLTTDKKVSLEVYIMSKCPDARDAYHLLVAPVMERVRDLVEFRVEFIGRATADGLVCMHGPSECLGNIVNACAQKMYSTSQAVPFTQCLLDDYRRVPQEDLLLRCAEENGLEFETINECASDLGEKGGMELVRESFQKASELGVRRSATIRLAGEDWCIRDGGAWKECKGDDKTIVEDLVRDAEEAVKALLNQ